MSSVEEAAAVGGHRHGYRPEIDGLRAIAVLPVILFHSGYGLFSGGYTGVDIFFVISGYLITGIIWKELDVGTFSIRSFYKRRARRILPALFVVMLCCMPFAVLWMMPEELNQFAQSLVAALAFAANIFFWLKTDYFSPAAQEIPMLHLWSLGVEEQFYVLFPLVLLLLRKWRATWTFPVLIGCTICGLAIADLATRFVPLAAFYLPVTRAWELLAGSCLAFMTERVRAAPGRGAANLRWAGAMTGLILIGTGIFALDETARTPGIAMLLPVGGASLIILCAGTDDWCGRFLALWPIRIIGLISYSAYLWHQPVIAFCKLQTIVDLGVFSRSLPVVLSLALAWGTWRYVEMPFRNSKRWQSPLLVALIASTVVIGLAGILLLLVAKAPEAMPAYAEAKRLVSPHMLRYIEKTPPSVMCRGGPIKDGAITNCHFGMAKPIDDLILWGDSYSGALAGGIQKVAEQRGLSVSVYFAVGCPPIVGLTNVSRDGCKRDLHRIILEQIAKQEGHATVLLFGNIAMNYEDSNRRIDGRPFSRAGVLEQLKIASGALKASGKRLIVIEQGPIYPDHAARFYIRNILRHRDTTDLNISLTQRFKQVRNIYPLQEAVPFIDTTDFFCANKLCRARDEAGALIVYDKDHLSEPYAERMVTYALDAIKAERFGLQEVGGLAPASNKAGLSQAVP